ncbi:serine hydrolase [Elizabethkingia argentiflava]|uniref:Serine hydrolase n=1 Tax=Elizabethkingia argenteiflava TaxID=2681556 RepID=A0A845PYK2_9FLAO|nr:serine hydrolase [Elizabethkingia argenteiflava]NAW51991.1 serine hydrolase [Elizabethkingia argenteiflava]
MTRYSAFFLVLLVANCIACKSDHRRIQSKKGDGQSIETLPNYSNVDLSKVFTPQDSRIENKPAIIQAIDEYYRYVWERGNLSGGILVAKGDEILYEKYRGIAREDTALPIEKNVGLHVASVSKPITAMAVMKLIEAGRLKLDQPLSSLFRGFPYPDITVEMLLKQRSGLPKYEHFLEKAQVSREHYITNRFILDFIIKNKPELARKPNTGFMYCNTNYALLALVVEKLTQMPFPEAMQEIVFKPLKMKHSFIFQQKDIPTASQSFYNNGKKYPLDYLDLVYGDKNVYTTPRDLYKFSKALFSKDFLTPPLKNLIFQAYSNEKSGVNNYGIGFRMKQFVNGETLTYHNGWWHGSNAVFVHLLKSKTTIIAIGNKYSPRVYSTVALSCLFEDFPIEKEILYRELARIPSAMRNLSYVSE